METTAPEIRWSRGRIHLLPRDTDAVRYRLEPVEGVSTSSLEAGMIAPIGATVSVRRNRPWGEATARWEWGDESRAAEVQIQGGEITAPVPAEAPSGAHLWLGIEEDGAVAWVDFIALPGVDPNEVEAVIDQGFLVVSGHRVLPPELRNARILRLELPQGRFDRRIKLPLGRYTISRFATNGCVGLRLAKSS